MPYLLSSELGFPENDYDQDGLLDALLELWGESLYNPDRLRAFFQNMKVEGRHLALPKERYAELRDFGARNSAFQEVALNLLERTVSGLMERSDFDFPEVGVLLSTTVTGLTVPTLEARLMNRLSCLLYTSPSPRDRTRSRMPSSA